jgi:hypothetical protein
VRYRAGTLCRTCIFSVCFRPRAAIAADRLFHYKTVICASGGRPGPRRNNPARDETILCFPRKDPETIAA